MRKDRQRMGMRTGKEEERQAVEEDRLEKWEDRQEMGQMTERGGETSR